MPPTVVTMGDPAGVGPDLTLAAWTRRESGPIPSFVVAGDPSLFAERARGLGLDVPVQPVEKAGDAVDVFPRALPVLPVPLPERIAPGQPDPSAASAVLAAIETGVDLVCDGAAAALVTNPINKALLYGAGFAHPGHTEFLGELAGRRGGASFPVMMLVCEAFRAVPATVHVPYKDVPGLLTSELIVRTARVTREALATLFGMDSPRIAVTGLNPHAGEDGALGREEIEIIVPAIEALRAEGVAVTGPHPADTIFQERLRDSYDAVVTMYHDQALIPVKTLAFDHAVNVTLGLPFVRTSPDHGTAYALAGTGEADPSSFIAALRLADRLGAARKAAA